jgi:hypothetical protein
MSGAEREPDPYWQEDLAIGESRFYRGETYSIRLRLHTATERYSARHEIVPLSQPTTTRTYVHGKPYILVPDVSLTVGLYPRPDAGGAIGEVSGSDWIGMRHQDIGQLQAWYYPTDHLLVLWECYPEERYRTSDDPRQDATLAALWSGCEGWLRSRFPEAQQLVTTWEDVYDRPRWQAFLEEQGYRPVAPAAFAKDLPPPTHAAPET